MKTLQATRILTLLIAIVVTGLVFQTQSCAQWEKITYRQKKISPYLQTECETDHQGAHVVTEVRAYLKDGLLLIRFPGQLPGYWGYMDIEVNQDLFEARPGGVPFVLGTPEYQVLTQKLTLSKKNYAPGDELNGYVNITYNEKDQSTQNARSFYFKGRFSTIVRVESFQAYADENIETYDLLTAVHELGRPIHSSVFSSGVGNRTTKKKITDDPLFGEPGQEKAFQTQQLTSAGTELLQNMTNTGQTIRALTWDISPDAELSDSGRERLTVWYRQKGKQWLPVTHKKWIQGEPD